MKFNKNSDTNMKFNSTEGENSSSSAGSNGSNSQSTLKTNNTTSGSSTLKTNEVKESSNSQTPAQTTPTETERDDGLTVLKDYPVKDENGNEVGYLALDEDNNPVVVNEDGEVIGNATVVDGSLVLEEKKEDVQDEPLNAPAEQTTEQTSEQTSEQKKGKEINVVYYTSVVVDGKVVNLYRRLNTTVDSSVINIDNDGLADVAINGKVNAAVTIVRPDEDYKAEAYKQEAAISGFGYFLKSMTGAPIGMGLGELRGRATGAVTGPWGRRINGAVTFNVLMSYAGYSYTHLGVSNILFNYEESGEPYMILTFPLSRYTKSDPKYGAYSGVILPEELKIIAETREKPFGKQNINIQIHICQNSTFLYGMYTDDALFHSFFVSNQTAYDVPPFLPTPVSCYIGHLKLTYKNMLYN